MPNDHLRIQDWLSLQHNEGYLIYPITFINAAENLKTNKLNSVDSENWFICANSTKGSLFLQLFRRCLPPNCKVDLWKRCPGKIHRAQHTFPWMKNTFERPLEMTSCLFGTNRWYVDRKSACFQLFFSRILTSLHSVLLFELNLNHFLLCEALELEKYQSGSRHGSTMLALVINH